MAEIDDFPGVRGNLDPSDEYENTLTEVVIGGERFVVVEQVSEIDGGQTVFRQGPEGWVPVASDTTLDMARADVALAAPATGATCGKSSNDDHAKVADEIVAQVGRFTTAHGPSNGRLACVFAVRLIVKGKLGREITGTDGTAVFDEELRSCFGSTSQEDEVPAGAIIISPTEGSGSNRNIGHVGLLGPGGNGTNRLIYSNASGAAEWRQNFTLGTWIERYRERKGLKVRFFPLPLHG